MARTYKQKKGDWGEVQAALFLIDEGYTIIEKNYWCRMGEIDIIATKIDPLLGKTFCFVEVKTRNFDDGSAERATNTLKRKKIERAAKMYCLSNNILIDSTPMCFEHVSVYGNDSQYTIRRYELPSS